MNIVDRDLSGNEFSKFVSFFLYINLTRVLYLLYIGFWFLVYIGFWFLINPVKPLILFVSNIVLSKRLIIIWFYFLVLLLVSIELWLMIRIQSPFEDIYKIGTIQRWSRFKDQREFFKGSFSYCWRCMEKTTKVLIIFLNKRYKIWRLLSNLRNISIDDVAQWKVQKKDYPGVKAEFTCTSGHDLELLLDQPF